MTVPVTGPNSMSQPVKLPVARQTLPGPAPVANHASLARWFVAHTQPNAEARAVLNLERQGFTTYMPRYLKRRRHARRVDMVAVPVFPRYVFVAIDLGRQRWLSIRSTIGVSRLVGQGDAPLPVPQGIIEAMMQRHDEQGFVRLLSPTGLRAGDKVRVLGGAFEESLGLLEQVTDEQRVTILLDMLGRKVRVTLDSGLIAAA